MGFTPLDVNIQKDLLIENAFEFTETMRLNPPENPACREALYRLLMSAIKFSIAVEQEAERRCRER